MHYKVFFLILGGHGPPIAKCSSATGAFTNDNIYNFLTSLNFRCVHVYFLCMIRLFMNLYEAIL